MNRRLKVLSVIAAFPIIIGGAVLVFISRQIEADAKQREQCHVSPAVDKESVAELGYVYDLRREDHYLERKREIIWWVKIPSTNRIYGCSWESGFSGFSRNDGVTLIHKRREVETADWGFIVGLHGKQHGQSAIVWAIDVEDLPP